MVFPFNTILICYNTEGNRHLACVRFLTEFLIFHIVIFFLEYHTCNKLKDNFFELTNPGARFITNNGINWKKFPTNGSFGTCSFKKKNHRAHNHAL